MVNRFLIRLLILPLLISFLPMGGVIFSFPTQAAASQGEAISSTSFAASRISSVSKKSDFRPVSFTDAFNREMSINRPLERIAIGHQFFAEYLVGIGAGDLVVTVIPSVVRESVFYPELSRKPATGALHESPDFEAIVASGAQVYVVNGLYACKADYHQAVETLEPVVKVMGLSNTTQKDIYATVALLGRITGHGAEAAAYNRFQRKTLEMIRTRVADIPDRDRIRTYFEPMGTGWTINDNCMGFGYQIPWAGGVNIAGKDLCHDFEWFKTDKEWLVTQNPQVILLRTPPECAHGYAENSFDGMKKHLIQSVERPEFRGCDAVKNRKVHSISWDLIGTPRMFIGIAHMAKLFYPERFEDMDPQALHQQYLDQFIGIDYDLEKNGTFIYPAGGSDENEGNSVP